MWWLTQLARRPNAITFDSIITTTLHEDLVQLIPEVSLHGMFPILKFGFPLISYEGSLEAQD